MKCSVKSGQIVAYKTQQFFHMTIILILIRQQIAKGPCFMNEQQLNSQEDEACLG